MNKTVLLTIVALSMFLSACSITKTIPMNNNLNDFVMMGTKSNGKVTINYNYESKVSDGVISLYDKGKGEVNEYNKISHTENLSLKSMIKEYLENKFTKIQENGNVKINVVLEDFNVEMNIVGGDEKAWSVSLVGGEMTTILTAKVKVKLNIVNDGKVYEKNIATSADENYVSGVGTGTQTSNLYRGADSWELTIAKAINSANNKVVMMMNSYFEEIGL
jgi:hypothetical protein